MGSSEEAKEAGKRCHSAPSGAAPEQVGGQRPSPRHSNCWIVIVSSIVSMSPPVSSRRAPEGLEEVIINVNTETDKQDYIRLKTFCSAKETINRARRQPVG